MRRALRFWDRLLSLVGWRPLNRRFRRRAAARRRALRLRRGPQRRRSVVRRQRFDHLEKRVVMNADPIADNDVLSATEDVAAYGAVHGSDADMDPLTYAVSSGPSNGSLSLDPGGSYSYTPNANYNGSDSFTFTAYDGTAYSTAATISITIAPVNDAPTTSNATEAVDEDGVLNGSVSGSDIDGDGLSFSTLSGPSNGTLSWGSGGAYTYTPNANYHGGDSFTFQVSDGNGGTASGTVDITVNSVNDLPTVDGISVTCDEDGSVSFTLTGSDADGDSLSFEVWGTAANGTASTSSYTPNANYSGTDSFGIKVTDGRGGEGYGTVSVTINPVNDAPTVAVNTGIAVNEGASTTVSNSQLQAVDVDNTASQITYTIVTGPANGTLKLNGTPTTSFTQWDIDNGYLTYLHDGSETTTDGFSFTLSDGVGGSVGGTPVGVTITLVNDPPTTSDQSLSTNEDTPLTVTPSGSDAEGHTLSFSIQSGPSYGSVEASGSNFLYTPATNYVGFDSFVIRVSDGNGGTADATISVTVNAVNDAPVVTTNTGIAINEGDYPTITSSVLEATDVDNIPSEITYTIVTGPAHGTLYLSGVATSSFTQGNINSGLVTYVHDGSETTSDGFSFTLSDGAGGSVGSTPVSVTITLVNDSPTLDVNTGITVAEGGTETITGSHLSATDPENSTNEITYSVIYPPGHGTLKLSGYAATSFTQADITNGLVTYTHDAGETTSDSFVFAISDGVGGSVGWTTFNITVTPVNDAPTTSDQSLSTDEDTPLSVTPSGADVDWDTLSYSVRSGYGPAHGSVEFTYGNFIYTPTANYNGTDSFTIEVDDGHGGIAYAVISITVNAVNDAPTIDANAGLTVVRGTTEVIGVEDLAVGDVDNTAAQRTFTLTAIPEHGTLKLNGVGLELYGTFTQADIVAGNLSYEHEETTLTDDSFTFTVADGSGGSLSSTTFSIDVVNGLPQITANSGIAVIVGDNVVITAGDLEVSDEDNGATELVFTIVFAPAHGTLKLDGVALAANDTFTQADLNDGLVTYEHDSSATSEDSFTFTVADGDGGTIEATDFAIAVVTRPILMVTRIPSAEGAASATFTFSLSHAVPRDTSIAWNTADRSAQAGLDYVAASGILTFPAGDDSATIEITLLDDARDEADELFVLELSDPNWLTLESNEVDTVIEDNDAPPTISIEAAEADESQGFIEFTVTLSAASDRVVLVDWTTENGTAGEEDFRAASGQVAFTAGEVSRKIIVKLIDDDTFEADKDFSVVLSNPINASISGAATVLGTVSNDDPLPQVRIEAAAAAEGAEAIEFRVKLSNPSESSVTVDWEISDGFVGYETALSLLLGSVTFAPGETEKLVTIEFVDDAIADVDRSFVVEISGPVGATLDTATTATMTIQEDDQVRVTAADQEFTESDGVIEFQVQLSDESATEVTIDWEVIADTALEGRDYELVKPRVEGGEIVEGEWELLEETDPRTLTFAIGTTATSIFIRLIDNDRVEGDLKFQVQLTSPVNATVQLNSAQVTVADDDIPAYLQDLGVTSENYAEKIPPTVSVEGPPVQDAPPSLGTLSAPDRNYAINSIATLSVAAQEADGLLAGFNNEEREIIHVTPFSGYTDDEYGWIEINADGSYVFRPNFDISTGYRSDSFTYELTRADGTHDSGTVTLMIDLSSLVDPTPVGTLSYPTPQTPEVEPTIAIYPISSNLFIDGAIGFSIVAEEGTTADYFDEYRVTYELRDAAGTLLKTDTIVLGTTLGHRDGFFDYYAPADWDLAVVATITNVEKFDPSTSTYDPRSGLIDLDHATANAILAAYPRANVIEINASQASQRNLESIATVAAGDVALTVKEGEVRLGFDDTNMAFTPTYIGNEQRYPIATIETSLAVTTPPTSITARLTVYREAADPIVGDVVTFDIPTGAAITSSDVLHFSVPLAGANLDDLGTGRYRFSVTFVVTESSVERRLTQHGEFNWVNRSGSTAGEVEFGQGWAIPELSRLVFSNGIPGIMLVNGDGSTQSLGSYTYPSLGGVPQLSSVNDLSNFIFNPHWETYYNSTPLSNLLSTGAGEATWTFTGLNPGKAYTIFPSWLRSDDLTTAAKYEVTQGRQLLVGEPAEVPTFIVDQRSNSARAIGLFSPDEDGVITVKLSHTSTNDLISVGTVFVEEATSFYSGISEGKLTRDENPAEIDGGFRFEFGLGDGTVRQYDLEGRLRKTTDVNGNRILYDYYETGTEKGLLHTVTTQGGLVTTFEYSGRSLDKITDPTGRVADYTIVDGLLTKIEAHDPGNGSQRPVVDFDYTADNLLWKITRTNKTVDDTGINRVTVLDYDTLLRRVDTITVGAGDAEQIHHFSSVAANQKLAETENMKVLRSATGAIGRNADSSATIQEAQATFREGVGTMDARTVYQTDRLGFVTALAKPKTYNFDEVGVTGFLTSSSDVALDDAVWTWERDYYGRVIVSFEPADSATGTSGRMTSYLYTGLYVSGIYSGNSVDGVWYASEEEWVYEPVGVDGNDDGDLDDAEDWISTYRLKEHKDKLVTSEAVQSTARRTTTYEDLDADGRYRTAKSSDGTVVKTQYTYKPRSINDIAGGLVDLTWDAIHGTTDYVYYGQESSPTEDEQKRIGLVKEVVYAQGLDEEAGEFFTYDTHRALDKQTDIYGVETDYDYDLLGRLVKLTTAATLDHAALIVSYLYDGLGNLIKEHLTSALKPGAGTRAIDRTSKYTYDQLGRLEQVEDVERGAFTNFEYEYVANGSKVTTHTPAAGETTTQIASESYYDTRGNHVASVGPQAYYYRFDRDADPWDEPTGISESVVNYATFDQFSLVSTSWTTTFGDIAEDWEKTQFKYDAFGHVTKITAPDPDGTTSSPLHSDYPTSLARPTTEYAYYSDGTLAKTSAGVEGSSAKRTVEGKSDSTSGGGMRVGVTTPMGEKLETIFDSAGRPTISFDERQNSTRTDYDPFDRLKKITDALNNSTNVEYFPASMFATASPPAGLVLDDRAVRVEKYTDANSHVTWKQFDAVGNLVRVVYPDPDGTATNLKETSEVFLYNADGTLAAQWQEYGHDLERIHRIDFQYDNAGRLIRQSDTRGTLATYTYDRLDNVLTAGNGGPVMTKTTYDVIGRVEKTELVDTLGTPLPESQPTTYGYDFTGATTFVKDASSDDLWFTIYDGLGRAIRQVERTFADATQGSRKTDTIYNGFGDVQTVSESDGAGVEYLELDELGRAHKIVEHNDGEPDRITRLDFDEAGNLERIIDADGNDTVREYDKLNRLRFERVSMEHPVLGPMILTTEYSYDKVGNLDYKIDASGRKIKYGYDALNRVTSETWVASSSSYVLHYEYDQAGRLRSMSDANVNYIYEYDERDRISRTTIVGLSASPITLVPTYDDQNRLASLTDSLGGSASYKFNSADQLERATLYVAGAGRQQVVWNYGEKLRLETIDRTTVGQAGTLQTEFDYDDLGRLKELDHRESVGGVALSHPAQFTYDYDSKGRLSSSTGPEGSRYYTYDDLDQLKSVTDGALPIETYDYDAHGNRESSTTAAGSTTYPPAARNRMDSDGTYTYEYDLVGNRTAKISIADGSREEYRWDFRNRLDMVTKKDGSGAVTGRVVYWYDGGAHLIKRQVLDASDIVLNEERYVYRGDAILFVLDETGVLKTRQFVLGGEVLGQQRTGEEFEWLLTDRLGSTRALVETDGTVVASYDYDSYGNLSDGSDDPTLVRQLYAGYRYDTDTKLYGTRHRWYDATAGRWISEDPIGFGGGTTNLSEYVGNDPLNKMDPSGLGEQQPRFVFGYDPSYEVREYRRELMQELGPDGTLLLFDVINRELYTEAKQYKTVGELFDFDSPAEERAAIRSFNINIKGFSDRAGNSTPWLSNPALTRIFGGLQAISGAYVAAAGSSLALTGAAGTGVSGGALAPFGIPLAVWGGAMATWGADQFAAGVQTAWNGVPVRMQASKALDLLTENPHTSEKAVFAVDFLTGVSLARNIHVSNKTFSVRSADLSITHKSATGSAQVVDDLVGRRAGQLYGRERLGTLTAYLEKRGVDLRIGKDNAFTVFAGDKRPVLTLRRNPTEYEVWHELSHYLQYRQVGKEAYMNLPRQVGLNIPEKSVFQMLSKPGRWEALNTMEKNHAWNYLQKNWGMDPERIYWGARP